MDNIIKDEEFKELMENAVDDILSYLLEKELSFGILCNISKISFEPELPIEIKTSFKPFTFFVLANYTLESARIEGDFLFFEAGFGEQNFASLVKVPLFAIFQIIVDENVLFLNMSATVEEFEVEDESKSEEDKSIDAILSNPQNLELLKKLKR